MKKLFATAAGALGALSLALASAPPALAAVPASGTVVEGHSVPGVALGATRQHVLAAWGKPAFCQSTGQAYCTWQLGNGVVDLAFVGANGGNPVRHRPSGHKLSSPPMPQGLPAAPNGRQARPRQQAHTRATGHLA